MQILLICVVICEEEIPSQQFFLAQKAMERKDLNAVKVNKGNKTLFWEDTWITEAPLKLLLPKVL